MNVPKIKAALYSIYMNKRGYTVLQNTVQPSTTVRAVKHYRIIDPYTLDIVENYHQITRNFDGIKPKKVERYLSTNKFAFYNEETNSVDYQTVSLYKKFETGKIMKKKKKGEINWDVLDKRDFSYVDKKVGRKNNRCLILDMLQSVY